MFDPYLYELAKEYQADLRRQARREQALSQTPRVSMPVMDRFLLNLGNALISIGQVLRRRSEHGSMERGVWEKI